MKSLIKKILKEEVDNRLKQVYFKQFDRLLLKNCDQITYPEHPDSIFFKRKSDGKIIAVIIKKNQYFHLDYNNVWSFFEDYFNLEYEEIQEIGRDWLDNTFKLRGYTTYLKDFTLVNLLDNTFKLRGYTTLPISRVIGR